MGAALADGAHLARAAGHGPVTPRAAELPPGPRAPAVWQTLAWMARPGAFLRGVHERFGDPATIRTYWTEEPMVLFSRPDAVREVFRLDPAIAPAGQSWEFLRPFAGPHSILLLDGEEHLRERRLMQGPFHGERMRAFAPMIARARARASSRRWHGRVVALERMRELTLEIILRVVFGARDDARSAHAARRRSTTRSATVRSLPRVLAMAVVATRPRAAQPVGALPGRGRALRRTAVRAAGAPAGRARDGDSMLALLLDQRDEDGNPPTDRHLRDQLVALLVGGHDSSAASLAWAFERLARHPGVHARLREGDPAYLDAVVKEVLRARPALTIAPRLLLEPAQIAGRTIPAGVQVAACLWLAMRREDLWPGAGAVPTGTVARGSGHPRRTRCRGSRSAAACAAAPAPRSPRWRCARCCAPPPA